MEKEEKNRMIASIVVFLFWFIFLALFFYVEPDFFSS